MRHQREYKWSKESILSEVERMATKQHLCEKSYKRHLKIVKCFTEMETLGLTDVNVERLSRRTLQICLIIKDQQDLLTGIAKRHMTTHNYT